MLFVRAHAFWLRGLFFILGRKDDLALSGWYLVYAAMALAECPHCGQALEVHKIAQPARQQTVSMEAAKFQKALLPWQVVAIVASALRTSNGTSTYGNFTFGQFVGLTMEL